VDADVHHPKPIFGGQGVYRVRRARADETVFTRRRLVDVMQELMKFTLLLRDRLDYLVDRYRERKESAKELSRRVNQRAI